MKKKTEVKEMILTIGLVCTALLLYGTIAFAQSSFWDTVAVIVGQKIADKVPVPDLSLSDIQNDFQSGFLGQAAVATSTSYYGYTRYSNLALDGRNIGGDLRYDMGTNTSNDLEYRYIGGNCTTNTTTAFYAQNTTGNTWYVDEANVVVTGAVNGAVNFAIGTSTDIFVSRDGLFATDTALIQSEGIYSIMHIGGAITANVATGTTYWLKSNPGANTKDGIYSTKIPYTVKDGKYPFNVNLDTRILPGEYIIGFATTTNTDERGVTSTASLWNCKYNILLKRSDSSVY
jgi:hypothetical protein